MTSIERLTLTLKGIFQRHSLSLQHKAVKGYSQSEHFKLPQHWFMPHLGIGTVIT